MAGDLELFFARGISSRAAEMPFNFGPATCTYCDIMLADSKERDRHLEKVHSIYPTFYRCPDCDEFTSRRKEGVKSHMFRVHGKGISCAEIPRVPREQAKSIVPIRNSKAASYDPVKEARPVKKDSPVKMKSAVADVSRKDRKHAPGTPLRDEKNALTATPTRKPRSPSTSRKATAPRPVFSGRQKAAETVPKPPEEDSVAPVSQAGGDVDKVEDKKESDTESSSSSSSSSGEESDVAEAAEPERKVEVKREHGGSQQVEEYNPFFPGFKRMRSEGTQTNDNSQRLTDSQHVIRTIKHPDGREETVESWTYYRYTSK